MATPKEIIKAAKATIDAAKASGGDAALRNLPVIALAARVVDGYDPSDPSTLSAKSVIVEPVVHPLIESQMELTTAYRRGRFTWSFGLGEENCDPSPLITLANAVRNGCILPESLATQRRGPADLNEVASHRSYNTLYNNLHGTPVGGIVHRLRDQLYGEYPFEAPYRFGAFTISVDGRNLYMKAVTHKLWIPRDSGDPDDTVNLNLRAAGRDRQEPKTLVGAEAIAVLDWADQNGFMIVDDPDNPGSIGELRYVASRSLAIWPAPGRPAEAIASVGRLLPESVRHDLQSATPERYRAARISEVTAANIARIRERVESKVLAIHPAVADVVAMEAAEPFEDERLKDYQKIVVGRHLATRFGLVNAIAPGMGKTVCTLIAMRAEAERTPGWRGLVIAEANVRAQWAGEAEKWFPEAELICVESRSQTDDLNERLEAAGDKPVLVLTSYALAAAAHDGHIPSVETEVTATNSSYRTDDSAPTEQLALFAGQDTTWTWVDTAVAVSDSDDEDTTEDAEDAIAPVGDPLGNALMSVLWNQLIADEAIGLRNTGSKLANALWKLRGISTVGVALTGTPIVRSLDDLGRMLAWARNDREMFTGARLEKQFDVSENDDLAAFSRAIGVLLFRRDKSEISDELPLVQAEVIRLSPTAAELNLATSAQRELKRAYTELVSWMEMAEQTDPDNPAYAEIREALVKARGAWLGGTQLARMSASDPAALLGSESAGAALLASQGLIEAATKVAGTKRQWALGYISSEVAKGERILLFTEFATVANGLIEDLRNAGLRVGAVLGGGGKARDRDIKAYMEGDLDVLISTSSGERGLNLQTSTQIIHYDLAWTPDSVVQRTGRVERIGATASTIKVVFPIMVGTVEDRVASLVVARAVTSMQALDASRGVAASRTEMGRALGGLAVSVDATVLKGKENRLLAITQELLAA